MSRRSVTPPDCDDSGNPAPLRYTRLLAGRVGKNIMIHELRRFSKDNCKGLIAQFIRLNRPVAR
jgi:hypothetical protein